MAPAKPSGRAISQQAFDEMVKENIDDLGMEPAEALSDAIETLTLQGVDLSGIVTSTLPGETNPVIQSLDRIKQLQISDWTDEAVVDEALSLMDNLTALSRVEGSGNAAIATRNGGIELMCSICSKLAVGGRHSALASALNALAAFLHDLQSTETFRQNGGPKMVVDILSDGTQNVNILNSCFSVVAAATTGNEVLKESFMDLHIDELMVSIMRKHSKGSIPSLYDAIRVLLTADDNRVVASQVYGYARQFAKTGIAEALVESLKDGISSPSLVSATIALKAVAVNDEICRSVAENGGIDSLLICIDDSGVQANKVVAKACCALLTKLAGSDFNKSTIIERGGLNRLITLSSRLADDPFVLQEVMSIICSLCLRSPQNAALAMEAGAGELAIQAMQKFPQAYQLQKNSCLMIRNLVARNPENRSILLSNGIEKIIRNAKESHKSCRDAATDALRDLGLENYNS
ncbi:armadillo repeat-containing protein 6 isoform X1 [Cynara cardunculus var. scolymus]|uniref:Armadillo-like helical n=2 Tax=Cynara cardunculus var. scolymus TaxID=59895 RepID=A0A124SHV9_CYNCS|nr:armadillo repeat-containing protein 6 isoform X1 [Cynara cardunculus var. scolymus]KVI10771.1 Armadillo-like helical [Cynara cardunculus var. scolymus]